MCASFSCGGFVLCKFGIGGDALDEGVEGVPLGVLVGEGAAAFGGDVVVLAFAGVFGGVGVLPLGADEAFLLEAVKDGVDGAFLPVEEVVGFVGEGGEEFVAVGCAGIRRGFGRGGKNKEVEAPIGVLCRGACGFLT